MGNEILGIKELRELLDSTGDKLSIFLDKNILNQYDMLVSEFIDLVKDFLSDEQKEQLLEIGHIKKLSGYIKKSIINTIIDDNIKMNLIKNDEIVLGLDEWQVKEVVESLGEDGKIQVLQDADFIEKCGIKDFGISKMISTLSDDKKVSLLSNKDLLENQLKMKDYTIKDIIASIGDEKTKLDMIDNYGLGTHLVKDIIQTFSCVGIKEVLLKNKYDFANYNITSLVASMDTDSLISFMNENKEFLNKNNISPYHVTRQIDNEKQMEFMSRFEDVELTIRWKETDFGNFSGRYKKEY